MMGLEEEGPAMSFKQLLYGKCRMATGPLNIALCATDKGGHKTRGSTSGKTWTAPETMSMMSDGEGLRHSWPGIRRLQGRCTVARVPGSQRKRNLQATILIREDDGNYSSRIHGKGYRDHRWYFLCTPWCLVTSYCPFTSFFMFHERDRVPQLLCDFWRWVMQIYDHS